MNVLFVCTGNTCRSPMAQAILQKIAEEKGWDMQCDSAGLFAHEGAGVSDGARTVLAECFGVDSFSHAAKPVTREIAAWADAVIGVTEDHRRYFVQLFGGAEKAFSLPVGVGDPFGGGRAEYEEAARAIRAGIEELIARGILHG